MPDIKITNVEPVLKISTVAVAVPSGSTLLTKAITGYDADPNLGGAPSIIQNAVLGTWFREETAAKWWRKTETVWEET